MIMTTVNELNLDNAALVLIDHQPFVAFPIQSISMTELVNNVTALAQVGKTLGLPTVLTTINGKNGPLADPLFSQISRVFPDAEPIDRTNTNAWSDPNFVAAIERTGRKKLIMAGLWTEVCLAQTTLSAIQAGYRVYFVSDASGGLSVESHNDAKNRMIQAGATPLTWFAVVAELCPDNSSPEYQSLYPIIIERGQGVSIAVQYVMANLPHRA
jgi:nicotinamidase-related amidase